MTEVLRAWCVGGCVGRWGVLVRVLVAVLVRWWVYAAALH